MKCTIIIKDAEIYNVRGCQNTEEFDTGVIEALPIIAKRVLHKAGCHYLGDEIVANAKEFWVRTRGKSIGGCATIEIIPE